MIVRTHGWQGRLVAFLAAERARPFAWGEADCATFATGAVEAQTGVDLLAPFRGRYHSALGAARLVRAEGVASAFDILARDMPEIAPGLAGPGDVVLLDGDVLGVVQGRHAYARTEAGLGLVDLASAHRALRVGDA